MMAGVLSVEVAANGVDYSTDSPSDTERPHYQVGDECMWEEGHG